MSRRYSIFGKICFLIIIAACSCKKETIVPPVPSFEYFPVANGTWVEYEVDSIYHSENDNNNDDSVYTYHFSIREEIDSTFLDGQGREAQVIIRYKRMNDSLPWILTDVWTQTLTLSSAYRTENNIPYHKLSFPITASAWWNGNDANTLGEEIYTYGDIHRPNTVGAWSFDSTVSVLQIDENNYIERSFGKEVYANGVGLVFKQRDELRKYNGVVVSGMEYQMRVTSYGN
jgi:hypothetical protein